MRDLSKDIEASVDNCIDLLNFDVSIADVKSEKLGAIMQSKIDTFDSAKKQMLSWQNSPNSPSDEKLFKYIKKLVSAGNNAIEVLRMALRKKIDPLEVDAERHGIAAKAKSLISAAIFEIDKGIIELQLQLDSGKIDLSSRDYIRGWPEKFANQEFYPEKDYFKQWHDKETDSIMICPKSTKGKVITLDGLNIMLPAVPKFKKYIMFSDLPKEQQYWRRTEMPKGLTPDNEDAYANYILEEFRRRREGVFFMNNGEVVYLTGSHYFMLQWCKMEDNGSYMDFRYAQLEMNYHTEACVRDKRCVGQFFVKSRRTGYTYEKICRMVNEATMTNNANFGITSKSDEDAKKAFSKLSYAFLNLPFFFRPVVKSKEDSKNQIEFAKPSNSTKEAKKRRDTQTDDYLNTRLDYQPTKEDSYDGQKMFRYLGDEASKWKRGLNYLNHWGQIAPTFNEGGVIVGKAFIGSTCAALKDGGTAFIKMYNQSLVSKRDKVSEMTATGLYAYFLPGHKNMTRFTDRYGVCHEIVAEGESFVNVYGDVQTIGSIQYLEAVRRQKKKEGMIPYNNELRAFPMTVEDAFRDEVEGALFDIEKINQQISFNRRMEIENTIVQGNFAWKDGKEFGTVEWRPSDKGRFLIAWMPGEEHRNKWVMKNVYGQTTKCPVMGYEGSIAVDPYDKDAVIDSKLQETDQGLEHSKGSRGAMHALTGQNLINAPSNLFFMEYICRPRDAETFFQDALMACIYFSLPILVENEKKMLLDYFYRNGYRGYCTTRFDKDLSRLSPEEKKYGGIPSSGKDMVHRHWTAIENYINKYVGEYQITEGETAIREEGECGSMPFNRTLNDWLRFDPTNRTSYDASISSGLAILAVNQSLYKPKTEAKKVVLKFNTYTN